MLPEEFHKQIMRNPPLIPKDSREWPSEWKVVEYKTYPRFRQHKLPDPEPLTTSLEAAFKARHSERIYRADSLSEKALSTLLKYSAGCNDEHACHSITCGFRHYPSAGARFPLEVYVNVSTVDGLAPGLYHYNVADHALEQFPFIDHEDIFYYTHCENEYRPSLTFIISARQYRSAIKYKDFGYAATLIEAGHLTQNLLLSATVLQLASCSRIGFNYDALHQILDLDEVELLLYTIDVG